MRLIAHRGFAGAYPENTLAAIRAASARADAVEIDVRRCGSGELVVLHDETVDRVTDGTGRVDEHTLDKLQACDVLGTGQGVPALEAALGAVGAGTEVVVELKETGTAADAIEVARDLGPQVTIASFLTEPLERTRELAPQLPRALVVAEDVDERLARASTIDCSFFHLRVDHCDETLLNAAHEAGMSVHAWTVEDRSTARRLAEVGVDGIIADTPAIRPETGGWPD